MNRPLKYADFGKIRWRLAYEPRFCLRHGLGKIRVIVQWMNEPPDFASVSLEGYPTPEKLSWLKEMERDHCVFDIRSKRFFWPRRLVEKTFKHHERRL